MSWAKKELSQLNLGDKRLNKRAILLTERLAENPTTSIPNACRGWAETQAAYRLFNQEDIGWQEILQPHMDATEARIAQQKTVLCIQDTTELDFNGRQARGLGELNYEARRGLYLHPTFAVSPDGIPLGLTDFWYWAREPKDKDGNRPGPKESLRWLEGYQRLAEMAPRVPDSSLIYVADRESDFVAFMKQAHDLGHPVDYLLRSSHNRRLPDNKGKLWDQATATQALGQLTFITPRRPNKKTRQVTQEVYASRIEINDGSGGKLPVTCVVAQEKNPPKGEKAITWYLLTNRDVTSLAEAKEIILWYRRRWSIEQYFYVLKQGCKVEELQLASTDRLEVALAIYAVVAWRLCQLMRLGRTMPELEAELYFEPEEWQAAYILSEKPLPKKPPHLNEVVRLIAGLGGFLGRKGDGEPGAKTLWEGLIKVRFFVAGLLSMRKLGVSFMDYV